MRTRIFGARVIDPASGDTLARGCTTVAQRCIGTRSPSTPYGSVDRPANPCAFALGAGIAGARAGDRRRSWAA